MNHDFLFTENFISTAKKNFDTVIFESDFSDKENDFLWSIAYHIRQEKKLLIVVSETPVDIIFPIIQKGKSNTVIINPSCWMTWFANKWFWDMRDISKARDFGLDVFEPLYQEEVIGILESNESSIYIRLNEHTPLKEQLPEVKKSSNWFLSFLDKWYSWSQWTILCFWSILIDALYGAGYLQEEWHAMDVFANSNPFFKIQGDFKESLKRTEKLIIIIDQHLGSLYDIWLMANLYQTWLWNVSISFITPYYQKISSVSTEYMYEQAQIDWIWIAQRIK